MASKQHKRLPEKHSILARDFRPRNQKQQELVELIEDNEVTIVKGIPGSGKTYVALATALNLLNCGYKRVVLVKSVVTLPGEEIGFLKGGINEKMEPHMVSFMGNIDKICGEGSAEFLLNKKLITIQPLAFIRGLSIDDSIVIVDEAQNLTNHAFKSVISRIGENSKYIFLGDTEQIDRKYKNESCLANVLNMFANSNLVGTIEFFDEDCVRNPIIPKILSILRENNI